MTAILGPHRQSCHRLFFSFTGFVNNKKKNTKQNATKIHVNSHSEASLLTGAAQTLLVKAPDELSTQVAPCEMGVTVGLEVVTHCSVSCVTMLDAHAISNQTHNVARATRMYGCRGSAGHRCSQLNWIINTEVLQLDQLTFGHPVLGRDTDMSGEHLWSMN